MGFDDFFFVVAFISRQDSLLISVFLSSKVMIKGMTLRDSPCTVWNMICKGPAAPMRTLRYSCPVCRSLRLSFSDRWTQKWWFPKMDFISVLLGDNIAVI